MFKVVRPFLVVLIAFALIGASSDQLARSARYAEAVTAAGMPCGMAMPAPDTARAGLGPASVGPASVGPASVGPASFGQARLGPAPQPMPCSGLTPDCIRQMGCLAVTALPAQPPRLLVGVRFIPVGYWAAGAALAGRSHPPEPQPPRTS